MLIRHQLWDDVKSYKEKSKKDAAFPAEEIVEKKFWTFYPITSVNVLLCIFYPYGTKKNSFKLIFS
jgi:hypothetical protein